MKCQKCGTEYEGAMCPNGCGGDAQVKKKRSIFKKWWFWLIVAVVVIGIASSGGKDSEAPGGESAQKTTVSTEANNGEATEEQQTTTEAVTAEDPYYRVGDVIEAKGLKINIVSAEKWESDNQFMQPEDGYMYFRIFISAENTSDTDRYLSSFEFTCYADGKKEDKLVLGGDGTIDGGELSSGRKTEGYLYFSVPVDAQQIEVEYETSFWTDKKAVIKIEL